ncbi:MAG: ABC transporter substrate-binding protein [Candidatus Kinetoplastibacterium crithidii]|nr:ABC transporter substrate-binding protein [Candidatus Kinetoplastibacterium crithidii]
MFIDKCLKSLLYGLLSVVFFCNAYAQSNFLEPADKFLLRVSEEAISAMKRELDPAKVDLLKLNEIVKIYMLPHVDFQKMTKLTAGRHWKTATNEQKEELIDLFRKKLIKTYSMALLQISPNATMSTCVNKAGVDNGNTIAKSIIKEPNGQSIQIGYRLSMTENKWKIYDVSIEGLWLVENYRSQFNKEINKSGINNLIKKLNDN